MTKALDDCFLHDRDRLRHDEALALLRDGLAPLDRPAEDAPLAAALGRVLTRDIAAPCRKNTSATPRLVTSPRCRGPSPVPSSGAASAT